PGGRMRIVLEVRKRAQLADHAGLEGGGRLLPPGAQVQRRSYAEMALEPTAEERASDVGTRGQDMALEAVGDSAEAFDGARHGTAEAVAPTFGPPEEPPLPRRVAALAQPLAGVDPERRAAEHAIDIEGEQRAFASGHRRHATG